MIAAALAPGKMSSFICKRPVSVLDIDIFHVTDAHANESSLRATARQHGIRLVRELVRWMFDGKGDQRGSVEVNILAGKVSWGTGAHRPPRAV